jgi:ACS family glucarate transporter-like MFS transporter
MPIARAVTLGSIASRSSARWWLLAPILIVFVIVNQLDKTNISVLIADSRFAADLGVTGQHARLGFLSTAFFIAYGFSLVLWGFVVDRIGPRRCALIGVLGWSLATGWCAFAGGITEMYLARFALGLTEGCMWPVCNTYVGRWFAVREHGRIQAFWINGNQIGIALGLPIVTAILLASEWRAVFVVFAAASVALLVPLFYWLAPDEPAESRWVNRDERLYIESHRPGVRVSSAASMEFLADRRFWLVALCHTCLVATFFGLTTWIPTYLTKARGLPFTTMSAWVACSYLIPVCLALAIGYVADRTMRRATIGAICSVVMAVMIVAAALVPNAIVSMLLLVVSMAAPMTYGAMNTSLMHSLVPPEYIGRATGIFVGAANVLGAAGPTIVGWLIGRFKGEYLAAFGFISAVNLAQAVLYWLIGRREASR